MLLVIVLKRRKVGVFLSNFTWGDLLWDELCVKVISKLALTLAPSLSHANMKYCSELSICKVLKV